MSRSAIAVIALLILTTSCRVSVDSASPTALQSKDEQAVFVHLKLGDSEFGSDDQFDQATALEDRLDAAINKADAGLVDGNDVGEGEYVVYIYGPDAAKIVAVIEPVLSSAAWPGGGFVVQRFGPEGAKEERRALPLTT